MNHHRYLILLAGSIALLTGCGRSDWEAVRTESGDTTVVRTVSGSVWGAPRGLIERVRIDPDPADSAYQFSSVSALAVGPDGEVYVVDIEGPSVRAYDADGRYLRTFSVPIGQQGSYSRPDGVAILSDGRVVIRDPTRSQFVAYSPRGNFLERWPHPSGVYGTLPLLRDAEDRLYTRVVYNPADPRHEWDQGLVRYGPDGAIEDTIPDPVFDYQPPQLLATSAQGDTARFPIPLTPRAYWARSPSGDVVRAISNRYALDLVGPDGGVLRIERPFEPVETSREERATLYRDVDRRARQVDYGWTWGGPVIPETKPPFKGLFVDQDGRIWVHLHQTAELRGEGAVDVEATEQPQPTPRDWHEPIAFDVFERDGGYLGRVTAPTGFRLRPQPVISGNTVWAVVSGEGGAQSVVRFEIE